MIIYAIIGIVWLMVIEKIIQSEDEGIIQGILIRILNFLLWPITFSIFIYHFIRKIRKFIRKINKH